MRTLSGGGGGRKNRLLEISALRRMDETLLRVPPPALRYTRPVRTVSRRHVSLHQRATRTAVRPRAPTWHERMSPTAGPATSVGRAKQRTAWSHVHLFASPPHQTRTTPNHRKASPHLPRVALPLGVPAVPCSARHSGCT